MKDVDNKGNVVNMLSITKCEFNPVTPDNGLIGFIQLIFNDCFLVEGIAVYRRLHEHGYRLVYPKKNVGTKKISLHYPTKPELSKLIEREAFNEINQHYENMREAFEDDYTESE